ncbi:MAG: peptidase domain-containing ABC transporter [Bacteroidales bacterium]
MARSFPFIHQYDSMDCGPACLCMISQYHGKTQSLSNIRNQTFQGKQGVSLFGISQTAEGLGFRSTAARIHTQHMQQIALPCLVHWNQNHFVVVFGIKRRKKTTTYQIADPAKGLLEVDEPLFEQHWISSVNEGKPAGIVLILEPTPDFYQQPDSGKTTRNPIYFYKYLKPYTKYVRQLMYGLTAGSVIQLCLPFLTQSIVDQGISNNNLSFIHLVLIAQLVFIISSGSVQFIRGWILLHIGSRINIALLSDFLIKLMGLPMRYFDSKQTGDLLQRVHDHQRIEDFLTNSSLNTLFSMVNVVLFGIVLWMFNASIFALFFAGSLVYIAWIQLFMKERKNIDVQLFGRSAEHQSKLVQLVTGMQEIKLHACEKQKRWEWESVQAALFQLQLKNLAIKQYQDSGAILINQAKNIGITALAASLVIQGEMTLGMMLSVQYIIGQLNAPIDQLIHFMRSLQDARLSMDRLTEIHQQPDEESTTDGKKAFDALRSDIQFHRVHFSYDGAHTVLHDINFHIPKGKQTAIVGMSGSGKTTLIKLLLAYYPLVEGQILLNGQKLQDWQYRSWRQQCGIVTQDGFMFSDSIANNIAPGVEHIDPERLQHAAELANMHQFISELPLGYNTKVGSEGLGLSQGQKQRLLIARAVYKRPEILILDEATNSLDANNERSIMENLLHFFKGKTILLVAHRLSTVVQADQIIVLKQGRVEESGTHHELLTHKGCYYQLVKNQLNI